MVKYTELSKLFFDSDLKIGMIEVLNKDAPHVMGHDCDHYQSQEHLENMPESLLKHIFQVFMWLVMVTVMTHLWVSFLTIWGPYFVCWNNLKVV